MALESDIGVFAVGIAGGAANELLHWWGLRESPHLPHYARSVFYWLVTLAMMLLGGALAWFQLGSQSDPLLAFQIGLAAPMLLEKMCKVVPQRAGAMGGGPSTGSLRDFLSG
jgi:hypothetical protein